MRKWNKKTKITVLVIFLILLALFAALCWKKRRGIYNTYMKLTGQEIPYSVQEKRMKKRWEKYIRKQGTEDVSWETVLHRIIVFLSPVWNTMCRDEVFFGDWMPDLARYL